MPPNAEPGKCYAKVLIEISEEDYLEFEENTYPIYIGFDPLVASKEVIITVQHPKTKWVKQEYNRSNA